MTAKKKKKKAPALDDPTLAKRDGQSFIAQSWKPWPKEPSGAWDLYALDRRMSDGVAAVRNLIAAVNRLEGEAALLRAKIAQEGEEAYWSAPKDEDRCTAMAAAYRAMRAAAKADAPDPHVLQDRLHGMLRMAVASEDSFNRLSPAGRRLIQAAEGFFASSREDRDDLNACWDALQAETKRADAAEARLAALLRAKIAQEEGA